MAASSHPPRHWVSMHCLNLERHFPHGSLKSSSQALGQYALSKPGETLPSWQLPVILSRHWVSMYLGTCGGMNSALLTWQSTFLMEASSRPPKHCFCPPGETLPSWQPPIIAGAGPVSAIWLVGHFNFGACVPLSSLIFETTVQWKCIQRVFIIPGDQRLEFQRIIAQQIQVHRRLSLGSVHVAHIVQILNWMSCPPELLSLSLLCVCIEGHGLGRPKVSLRWQDLRLNTRTQNG